MSASRVAPVEPLPVDTFKDAAPFLRRPFTAAAVKFKVQSNIGNDGGLIVAYIDARLAVERLNLVCPHLWADAYEPLGGKHLVCHLTVDGITRRDVGEGTGKGLYSDALKRAAVKFGVGVSLYAVPSTILNVGRGLKQANSGRFMTPDGERQVRATYQKWLKDHGIKAFGEPLDHGDVEGAQGDIEAGGHAHGQDAPPVPAAVPDGPPAEKVSASDAEALNGLVSKAVALSACSNEWLADAFSRAGASAVSRAAVKELDAEKAADLAAELIGVIDVKERLSAAA